MIIYILAHKIAISADFIRKPVIRENSISQQGAHWSGKSPGFFLQGQANVREFCKHVREIKKKSSKVREKSGNFKTIVCSNPSNIEQTDMR